MGFFIFHLMIKVGFCHDSNHDAVAKTGIRVKVVDNQMVTAIIMV